MGRKTGEAPLSSFDFRISQKRTSNACYDGVWATLRQGRRSMAGKSLRKSRDTTRPVAPKFWRQSKPRVRSVSATYPISEADTLAINIVEVSDIAASRALLFPTKRRLL